MKNDWEINTIKQIDLRTTIGKQVIHVIGKMMCRNHRDKTPDEILNIYGYEWFKINAPKEFISQ